MAESEKERREREERERVQREQQRYGDFVWGLPDEAVDDLDAEDDAEVEQEQASNGD